MTDKQLKTLTKKWQKRLRLQDWDITVRFEGPAQLDGDVGRARIDLRNGTAEVLILPPKLNTNTDANFSNTELSLVHELIHILLKPMEDKVERWVLEQTIEKIAKAYLEV